MTNENNVELDFNKTPFTVIIDLEDSDVADSQDRIDFARHILHRLMGTRFKHAFEIDTTADHEQFLVHVSGIVPPTPYEYCTVGTVVVAAGVRLSIVGATPKYITAEVLGNVKGNNLSWMACLPVGEVLRMDGKPFMQVVGSDSMTAKIKLAEVPHGTYTQSKLAFDEEDSADDETGLIDNEPLDDNFWIEVNALFDDPEDFTDQNNDQNNDQSEDDQR